MLNVFLRAHNGLETALQWENSAYRQSGWFFFFGMFALLVLGGILIPRVSQSALVKLSNIMFGLVTYCSFFLFCFGTGQTIMFGHRLHPEP